MIYCFEAITASREFHVYKEMTWSNAKVGDKIIAEVESNLTSIAHDPYSCAIKAKHEHFTGWKTVGYFPREISLNVYFFIKQEGGRVYGKLKSLKYEPSPIPSGGLQVPLLLKFESQDKWVTDTMEEFLENFYSFDFAGDLVVNDKDEEEINFETLGIENWNKHDESDINEKNEETVTLHDSITNETKEVLVVNIDRFMILKPVKRSKNGYSLI